MKLSGVSKTSSQICCLISDDKLTIILAVVIPIALLAVVAGVVAFCMWKKKKDKG